jgi:hypothetical protein
MPTNWGCVVVFYVKTQIFLPIRSLEGSVLANYPLNMKHMAKHLTMSAEDE